jgi:predicted phosphodiesterase
VLAVRLAVFGDVHGNLPALEAVLDDVRRQGAEALLCTGDLVNYGPEPVAVLDRVLAECAACVAGNHDRLLARWNGEPLPPRPGRDMAVEERCLRWTAARLGPGDRGRLAALPDRITWPEGRAGEALLLVHGSPRSTDEYVRPDEPDDRWEALAQAARAQRAAVVLMGHTHLPMHRAWEGLHFFNPGSVGWPKDGDRRASYGLVAFQPDASQTPSFSVRRVAYDADAVATAMRRAGLPAAVAMAMASGRPG